VSLIKLPLRIAAQKALLGRTYSGPFVFDSVITPLETQVNETKGNSFIAVYTDDAHLNSVAFNVRDLIGFQPRVSLTFHLGIAKGLTTISANKAIELSQSDASLEMILDIQEAQILRVLQTDQNPWSNLFRALALRFSDVHIRRGASSRKGLRFAAREIVLPIEGHPDPLGTGNEYPWNTVIDVFKHDPDLDEVAAMLEDFCTTDQMKPAWRKDFTCTGFDQATARALGLVTHEGDEILWI